MFMFLFVFVLVFMCRFLFGGPTLAVLVLFLSRTLELPPSLTHALTVHQLCSVCLLLAVSRSVTACMVLSSQAKLCVCRIFRI